MVRMLLIISVPMSEPVYLCSLSTFRRGIETLQGASSMRDGLHKLHQALQLKELGVCYQLHQQCHHDWAIHCNMPNHWPYYYATQLVMQSAAA